MESVENKIFKYIQEKLRRSVFFADDFVAFSVSKNINKALERLHDSGKIARVATGIYVRPKVDKVIGTVLPSVEEIVKAIAERDKARIVPTGAQALYKLGLSNQVPVNVVYYTDASARKVKVGKRNITFKKASAKTLSMKGKTSTLAIQALKTKGKRNLRPEEVAYIREKIKTEDKQLLQHDLNLAPAWIRDLLQTREDA
jgi:uncharacterized protein (UPF0261 family)